jgi:hypothetical protein
MLVVNVAWPSSATVPPHALLNHGRYQFAPAFNRYLSDGIGTFPGGRPPDVMQRLQVK